MRVAIAACQSDVCALQTLQVLSVETALSIQSHPDKALAQRLHAERPQARAPPHSPDSSPPFCAFHAACHSWWSASVRALKHTRVTVTEGESA